ncbi:MAG: flippase-like domain-containing protein [Rhodospirillales bacterium]
MNFIKLIFLLLGLVLLALVVGEIELSQVVEQVKTVGWGMAVIVGIYFLAFLIDSFTWQMALIQVPLNAVWTYRTWKVRMVGEVFNNVVPAGGFGGEPLKAVLLKRYYGVGYREGTASLILAKTINLLSLLIFLACGFALMAGSGQLPASFKMTAGAGLSAMVFGIVLFFLVQRLKVSSITGAWISRFGFAKKADDVLHHIQDMDERLVRFYTLYKTRFAGAIGLAFVNWLLGAVEIYYAMMLLGRPMSFADCWIIEAAAQLVRAGAFFIPAGIGVQEGTFLLLYSAMTGSPVLGVSMAVIRRLREIIWIMWGLGLGAMFTFKPAHQEGEEEKTEGGEGG